MFRPSALTASVAVVLALATAACTTPGQASQQAIDDAIEQANETSAQIIDQVNETVEQAFEQAGTIQSEALSQSQSAAESAQAGELSAEEAAGALADAITDQVEAATGGTAAVVTGLNTTDLPAAAAALEADLGPLTLLELSLTPTNGYRFQVRNPDMPEHVDAYDWSGGSFSAPQPVRLVGGGDLDDNVFSLEGIDLTVPERLLAAAHEQDIEGAEVSVMTLHIDPFRGLVWSVPISGDRASHVLFADVDGTIIELI